MAGNLELTEINAAIDLIQSFDPPGVGARDTVEALLLQLKRRNCTDEKLYTLLQNHSGDLERNHLPQIAKAMNITVEEIYSMLAELKKLNFIPAVGLENHERTIHAVPEMSIELENDYPAVNSRNTTLPRLGIVQQYLDLLEKPETPEETRHYLREKLANAENLLKSLELRQDTLTRITNVIAKKQADFFRYGIAHLQPMTMSEMAQELDLHETTVSRAVANKYLDTPQGLKEYRFFFSSGYKNASGEDISSRGVKEEIKQMIANEDPRKPLSDAAIAQKLADNGLDIARRTVAKYRESMNIPPTNLRRKH
jgi:RNA polymerase sigma-54 factor